MRLTHLAIRSIRNLTEASLEPSAAFNLITGANASGKTSLLEGLHCLGLARSFRHREARAVISHGQDLLSVVAKGQDDQGRVVGIGVEKRVNETRIRYDGESLKSAVELAQRVPLVLITPQSQELVAGGGSHRRRLMDWALFHVEPDYYPAWARYQRALKQRNAWLRSGGLGEDLTAWDQELIHSGSKLDQFRLAYADQLSQDLASWIKPNMDIEVAIEYRRGWPKDRGLAEALAQGLDNDRRRGHTGAGPHRADLAFKTAGGEARHILSRGQTKLFAAGILLNQVRMVQASSGLSPIVLVDDLPSELDQRSRAIFLQSLDSLGVQVFITATEPEMVAMPPGGDNSVFHVEQGKVSKMV